MKPATFVSELGALRFANAFNPYSDRCSLHDLRDAPRRRTRALTAILEAACNVEMDSIWVGRDLGYRGGRRTGLALTDDMHFHRHLGRWGTRVDRPTKGHPIAERTASVIWEILNRIDRPIFLWNVFPLHPHADQDQFTNRSHNARERRAGIEVLQSLIELLRPKRLIALGNDAADALNVLAPLDCVVQVRHPSYGGQSQFMAQISELYNLRELRLL